MMRPTPPHAGGKTSDGVSGASLKTGKMAVGHMLVSVNGASMTDFCFVEVLEAHRLAGDIDYILKVRVANARAYDVFYQALISEVKVHNVTALLSMEEIKNTTALPL